MGGRAGFELRTAYSKTMIIYYLSQKFKLLGNGEFNHIIVILTLSACMCGYMGMVDLHICQLHLIGCGTCVPVG